MDEHIADRHVLGVTLHNPQGSCLQRVDCEMIELTLVFKRNIGVPAASLYNRKNRGDALGIQKYAAQITIRLVHLSYRREPSLSGQALP